MTAHKDITLDDLTPETRELLFNGLQTAYDELEEKYGLSQIISYADHNVAKLFDLTTACFRSIAKKENQK